MELSLSLNDVDNWDEQIRTMVLAALPTDFAVDNVVVNAGENIAAVTIRFGYTSATVEMTFAAAGPVITQQGDVNFDGIVDASDVNYIYRSVMGYVTLTEAQNIFANFNDDNIVDSADVNLLYRYVIGEIKSAQSQ